MTKAAIWAILILATGAVITGLIVFKDLLTQLALALVLWLAIEALAVHVRRWAPKWPDWVATLIAIAGILGVVGFVGYEVVRNVAQMAAQAATYEAHVDKMVADIYASWHLGAPPTTNSLLQKLDVTAILRAIADGVQNVAGNTVFILIYLGFMFPAAARIHEKLDRVFPESAERSHARDVLTAIRRSMAQYLWLSRLCSTTPSHPLFSSPRELAFGSSPSAIWWRRG
jgi:predicted PurR-regulated permease PerM